MNDALKPCPFCWGPATRLDGNYDFGGEWFETGCDNVGCRVLPSVKTLSREHADECWNTRAPADPLADERVLALVDAARELVTCVNDGCFCSEMKMAAAHEQEKARAEDAEAAIPAAYRLGLVEAAKTAAAKPIKGGRPHSSLHHTGLRDGRSQAARLIRALPTPTAAELIARIAKEKADD